MRILLIPILLLTPPFVAAPAIAQDVQRCTAVSGETVYTDKRCEDVGAVDRLPEVSTPQVPGSHFRRGCSRTLSDLVHQITAAVQSGDVNRLASLYQWSGVSDAAANRILDRLETVVERPLVDIVPVRPSRPVLDEQGEVVDANSDGYYPQTTPQRPVGLRLEQTLRNSATPSQTVFGLQRNYNCFWITL